MTDLAHLEHDTLSSIAAAADEAALESARVAALGKKGAISALLSTLGKMAPDERRARGAEINVLKDKVVSAFDARREVLKAAALEARLAAETIDVTLPVRSGPLETGRIHPISQVMDELSVIFADMGFSIAEGPDIETDDFNFTKLNFPPDHPARDMHDTFFFPAAPDGTRRLLRTHTSPVQVRTMLGRQPPIRVICPGRTYRCDSDQTHTPMFHQVEGLVIDRTANLGHLKWVLQEFLRAFFEVDEVKMRFRPSFFFRSPSPRWRSTSSAAAAMARSASARATTGWRSWAAGWVHPNVLTNCGIDPQVYQGFAWGIGIDRIAMLKYGMPDLRAFFESDVRWLEHYGFRPLDIPSLIGGLTA